MGMKAAMHRKRAPAETDNAIAGAICAERDRLAGLIHGLAERIESAPVEQWSDSVAWIAEAVEPVVRTVNRTVETMIRSGAAPVAALRRWWLHLRGH
jgi:nitrogen-specific signal transduction histidine kinase